MVDGVDITKMPLKDLKQYILDNVTANITSDSSIQRYYKKVMCRNDYDDANGLKEVVEYYLIELDKSESQTNSFNSENNMRQFLRPGSSTEGFIATHPGVIDPDTGRFTMVPVTDIPEGETTPNPEQTPRPKHLELPAGHEFDENCNCIYCTIDKARNQDPERTNRFNRLQLSIENNPDYSTPENTPANSPRSTATSFTQYDTLAPTTREENIIINHNSGAETPCTCDTCSRLRQYIKRLVPSATFEIQDNNNVIQDENVIEISTDSLNDNSNSTVVPFDRIMKKYFYHRYSEHCDCPHCTFTKQNPRTIVIRELMDAIFNNINNNPQVSATDVGEGFMINNGHAPDCNCTDCFHYKKAIQCVNKYVDVISGKENDPRAMDVTSKLAKYLSKQKLFIPHVPTNPEDVIYEAYHNTDVEELSTNTGVEDLSNNQPSNETKVDKKAKPLLLRSVDKMKAFKSAFKNKRFYSTAPKNENITFKKVYHISDIDNFIVNPKVVLKFFESIDLDKAWNNYPSTFIKYLALDKCIELNIQLQTYPFDHDLSCDCKLPLINLVQNAPIDLTEIKHIFEFIFFIVNRVNKLTELNDNLYSDKGLEVIFEYKYINLEDYNIKVDLFKNNLKNENFPFW
uniref:hypothetical protein n=1 Tax=Porodaedalea mongolica TaxID=2651638 RepID=UPI0021AC58C5|nr:hypothetical protein NYK79_mgp10 [Porodaedalea mongolica]UUA03980.1 hypothetical protein [Porodaedalea mongolica]WCF76749.1 hypothetical protein [Porodaedalea mongolica]